MNWGQLKADCANLFIDDDVNVFDGEKKGKLIACKILSNHVRVKSDFKFCNYCSGLRCQFGECRDYRRKSKNWSLQESKSQDN
jgi:hypothetical protein